MERIRSMVPSTASVGPATEGEGTPQTGGNQLPDPKDRRSQRSASFMISSQASPLLSVGSSDGARVRLPNAHSLVAWPPSVHPDGTGDSSPVQTREPGGRQQAGPVGQSHIFDSSGGSPVEGMVVVDGCLPYEELGQSSYRHPAHTWALLRSANASSMRQGRRSRPLQVCTVAYRIPPLGALTRPRTHYRWKPYPGICVLVHNNVLIFAIVHVWRGIWMAATELGDELGATPEDWAVANSEEVGRRSERLVKSRFPLPTHRASHPLVLIGIALLVAVGGLSSALAPPFVACALRWSPPPPLAYQSFRLALAARPTFPSNSPVTYPTPPSHSERWRPARAARGN